MSMAESTEHSAGGPGVASDAAGRGVSVDTYMRVTEITVSVVPEDDINRHLFEVKVSYRGDGRYAVTHLSCCLGADGEWEYEPHPSAREDDWLATHRFDFNTAYRLAINAAPGIECNGLTAAEYMARRKAR